jgi:hypothetical protein
VDRRRLLASAVIVVMAFVAYRPALSAYFFDDDFQWLVGTWAFTPWQLVDIAHLRHFYRPVIDVYFAVGTPLFRGSPTAFHVANITLHAVNALVLLALARAISERLDFAFLAALFFVVQPGDVDAVAWVSALAEPVSALFGCLALLAFVHFRRTGRLAPRVLSVLTFALALLTHESSVVFAALLVLADWAFFDGFAVNQRRGVVRRYLPYAAVIAVYLAIDLSINRRNYVVTQGHYAIGLHVFRNAGDYLSALYVGRGNIWNYALIAIGLVALFVKGSRRVVFAAGWIVVALLPFLFFTWSNTSRYLYLPAMGFGMLVAAAVLQLDAVLASRIGVTARQTIVALLVVAIAGRFTAFAIRNVNWFAQRTEGYRGYLAEFRHIHGDVPVNARVLPDPRLPGPDTNEFLTAAVRWEYRDPTIELIP